MDSTLVYVGMLLTSGHDLHLPQSLNANLNKSVVVVDLQAMLKGEVCLGTVHKLRNPIRGDGRLT